MSENYREKYARHYGIKIPEGWVIHHVDGNHNNNALSNLIMVTKHEHSLLHTGCVMINGVIHKKCNVCGQWKSYHFYLGKVSELYKSCYDCRQVKKLTKIAKKNGYYTDDFKELIDYTPGIFMGKLEYKGKVLRRQSTEDDENVDNLVSDEKLLLKL